MAEIDRPYRHRRLVLFMIGAATGLLNELTVAPTLPAPFFGATFWAAALNTILFTAFGYWIGARLVRKYRNLLPFSALLPKFVLGHSRLPLQIADLCFLIWGMPVGAFVFAYLFQRWFSVMFTIPIAGAAVGLVVGVTPIVRAEERERRLAFGLCVHCGYDLTGNVSGTCPECGEAVEAVE